MRRSSIEKLEWASRNQDTSFPLWQEERGQMLAKAEEEDKQNNTF